MGFLWLLSGCYALLYCTEVPAMYICMMLVVYFNAGRGGIIKFYLVAWYLS